MCLHFCHNVIQAFQTPIHFYTSTNSFQFLLTIFTVSEQIFNVTEEIQICNSVIIIQFLKKIVVLNEFISDDFCLMLKEILCISIFTHIKDCLMFCLFYICFFLCLSTKQVDCPNSTFHTSVNMPNWLSLRTNGKSCSSPVT